METTFTKCIVFKGYQQYLYFVNILAFFSFSMKYSSGILLVNIQKKCSYFSHFCVWFGTGPLSPIFGRRQFVLQDLSLRLRIWIWVLKDFNVLMLWYNLTIEEIVFTYSIRLYHKTRRLKILKIHIQCSLFLCAHFRSNILSIPETDMKCVAVSQLVLSLMDIN